MTSTIFDTLRLPPISRLLGWQLITLDAQAGTIEVAFVAGDDFANPSGFVQGGMIAAMLDDTLGPAVFAQAGGTLITTTIDLHLHYIRPVRIGRVTTTARVINIGARIAFVEGKLFDLEGRLCATASASAVLTPAASGSA